MWLIPPPLLALLAFPAIARHLPAHLLSCGRVQNGTTQGDSNACCDVATTSSVSQADRSGTESQTPMDPAREVVFDVQNLECPAVKEVGCGSMLAPVLARLDRIEGVSRSFSNWTGTRLRISLAPGADRKAVAARVRALLSDDGRQPIETIGEAFTQALKKED